MPNLNKSADDETPFLSFLKMLGVEEKMITRDLKVKIKMDHVLHQIDCYKDSDIYEEVIEEYRAMEEEIYELCEPVFLMEYNTIGPDLAREGIPEGTPVLMVLYSIGRGISDYSTKAFAEGDYLKGMLADAMADSALFSLDGEVVPYLKEACATYQMGISRRLEAPQDISMLAQKVIFETTKAAEHCGMGISSGYMLDPVKSNAVLYVLTQDKNVFLHQHNCRNCDRYDCKMRNIPDIPVKVCAGEKIYSLLVKEKESILDALMVMDASFSAVCGGTGRCGKCKIRVTEGYLPATSWDVAYFSKEELESGMRLSCKACPTEPVQVELNFRSEAEFQAVVAYHARADLKTGINQGNLQTARQEASAAQDNYGIAVDIGTTTIAMQLLSFETGECIGVHAAVNHQRNYGADVISRIKAATEGKKEALQAIIQRDLQDGIRAVVQKSGVEPEKVNEIAIAGNTTMIHLLMGYDCKGLGEYPFTPVNMQMIEETYEIIIGDSYLSARVRILPGISTYVGGDIVAGLYSCDVDQSEEYSLLIDLGTNGEIALGNRDKIMVTSTAAGPAFEGGNITWGVGSIEGAISGISIVDGKPRIRTIGDKAPTGICGTGVIETVAELVKEGLVDETGYLDEDYFDDGYPLARNVNEEEIVFTQKDVREIQLAKAAVRAGIETLFLRYGIGKEQVSHVYLAGGFGFKLDCGKAIDIGMIPEEFSDKVEAIGNSSLGGAVKCLMSKDGWQRTSDLGSRSEEIPLSADKDFNNFYMEYMYF